MMERILSFIFKIKDLVNIVIDYLELCALVHGNGRVAFIKLMNQSPRRREWKFIEMPFAPTKEWKNKYYQEEVNIILYLDRYTTNLHPIQQNISIPILHLIWGLDYFDPSKIEEILKHLKGLYLCATTWGKEIESKRRTSKLTILNEMMKIVTSSQKAAVPIETLNIHITKVVF
jgi:hypothetical protein